MSIFSEKVNELKNFVQNENHVFTDENREDLFSLVNSKKLIAAIAKKCELQSAAVTNQLSGKTDELDRKILVASLEVYEEYIQDQAVLSARFKKLVEAESFEFSDKERKQLLEMAKPKLVLNEVAKSCKLSPRQVLNQLEGKTQKVSRELIVVVLDVYEDFIEGQKALRARQQQLAKQRLKARNGAKSPLAAVV